MDGYQRTITRAQSSRTSTQLLSTAPPYTPYPESNVHTHGIIHQHASVPTPFSRRTSDLITSVRADHSNIPNTTTRKRRLSQYPTDEMSRPATRPFSMNFQTMHKNYDTLSSTTADSLLPCHSAQTASRQVTADRDPYHLSREASSLSSWIWEA